MHISKTVGLIFSYMHIYEGKPKAKKKTEKTTKGSYTEGSGRSSKFKSRPFWEEEDFGPPQYQEVATDGSGND